MVLVIPFEDRTANAQVVQRDKYWRETVERNFRYHAAYFSARKVKKDIEAEKAWRPGHEPKPDFVRCSGDKANALIDDVIKEYDEEQQRKVARAKADGTREEPPQTKL
jgi:hypothetical protein